MDCLVPLSMVASLLVVPLLAAVVSVVPLLVVSLLAAALLVVPLLAVVLVVVVLVVASLADFFSNPGLWVGLVSVLQRYFFAPAAYKSQADPFSDPERAYCFL